jgi:SAM-dependent methyltransferase
LRQGDEMSNWFEDDTFWESLDWFLFSQFRTDEITLAEADQITKLLQPADSAVILDLCCGPGRHCLQFARRGFRVTGVDRTARYLQLARRRAQEQGLDVEFFQADMRAFRRPEHFDFALSLFSSFGYFENPHDDLQVLRNLHESLKPGGKLLMEMLGKEPLCRDFKDKHWHHRPGTEEYLLQEVSVRSGWDWIENRWTLIRGRDHRVFNFGIRVYSGAELARALREAGFSQVELYGSLKGTPYDNKAERLVAVAIR